MKPRLITLLLLAFLITLIPASAKIVGSGTATPILGPANNSSLGGIYSLTCSGTDKISAIQNNGQPICSADVNSGGNVSGLGTESYIPLWTTTSTLDNSVIYQNGTNIGINGKVGIDTASPGYKLEVNGNLQADDYHSGDGSQGITNTGSYWLCTTANCSSTCQISIKDGLITGCT